MVKNLKGERIVPKFSIIIPVYNVEEYLDTCLESVLSQSYTDFEVVLVDDGSTDKSGEICNRWAEKDERIKVIHKSNGGLSSARNSGLDAAIGRYTVYLDSDDYWLSDDILEKISDRLAVSNAEVLVFNFRKDFGGRLSDAYFSIEIQSSDCITEQDSVEYIFSNNLWTACAWNKVVRKELFSDGALCFREGVIAEDVDWCYRLALRAKSFDYLNLCVVGYRQRNSSITGTMSLQKFRDLLENVQICLKLSIDIQKEKNKYLLQYVSFQYGILLYDYAALPDSIEKRGMFSDIKNLAYLLDYSSNPKIKLIRSVKKAIGLRMTLVVLAARSCLERFRNRRSD